MYTSGVSSKHGAALHTIQKTIMQPDLRKLASFPGLSQLSITCSTEERGEPGIFSHMSMM